MGFKDAEWAYGLDLPMREKVVLAALCNRTDDATHETFVGQQTIASMIGCSVDYVTRALRALESAGAIVRERRHGKGGFRTSDLTRLNPAYQAENQEGSEPRGPGAYKAVSRDLTRSQPEPTQTTAGAKEINQGYHSDDHSVTPQPPDRFDDFYSIWPKKVDKPAARRAWAKATKRSTPDQIITAAAAYRDNPNIPPKQYIRNPATWLNGDGWNDELPGPRGDTKPTPTDRVTHALESMLGAPHPNNITRLPRKEISA